MTMNKHHMISYWTYGNNSGLKRDNEVPVKTVHKEWCNKSWDKYSNLTGIQSRDLRIAVMCDDNHKLIVS